MNRKFIYSALIGLCFSTPVLAASMAANIASIWELNGKIYVSPINAAWDGTATSCTPATPTYIVDPNTAVGRSRIALLIMAKETAARVYLVGDGTCVAGGPNGVLSEGLNGIQLM